MTRYASPLTDERLRRALSELAAGPDGSDLLIEVLRTVDSTAQVGRRPWDVRGWGRPMLVLAAVLLITAAIGLAVAASPRPQPQPTPVITVSDFIVPFTYRLPAGETGTLASIGAAEPGVIYARQTTFPRRLEVFLVTGLLHNCLGPGAPGDNGTFVFTDDPSAFLQELRDTAGVGLGSIRPATLGNLSGWGAEVDPAANACGQNALHETGLGLGAISLEAKLDYPGKLLVARSGETTIGVLITASSEDELAEWLPIAQAVVDTFVFSTP